MTTEQILEKMIKAHYIIQIYPLPNAVCAMFFKIGVQGGHLIEDTLEQVMQKLYQHSKEQDSSIT